MEYVIGVILLYILYKIFFRKRGTLQTSSISIGMTPEEVRREIGRRPDKSDGVTIKENWKKEVLYYGEYQDEKTKKTMYQLRVVYINGKAAEIHGN